MWREMYNETAGIIVKNLEQIFFERGPVHEILMDNDTAFKSKLMREFLNKWNATPYYRAAYRASGNGIVERHYRTTKSMAEKANINPAEAVYWYNISPRSGQDEKSVSQISVFSYVWRQPGDKRGCSEKDLTSSSPVENGEEVWVKPPHSTCTSQYSGLREKSRLLTRNAMFMLMELHNMYWT